MTLAQDLSGKLVWITGASSGIGLHLCELMSRHGADVVASSRAAMASPALRALNEKTGRITALDLDVADAGAVAEAAARVRGLHGHVDVLINNAGAALERAASETNDAEWSHVLATNLTGPFLMCRALLPLMRTGSSIVNVSSVAAHKALRSLSAYSASKAGLEQFGRVLAVEAALLGIRVNTVAPGYIRTPMNADYLASEASDKLRRAIPMRRFGEPTDLDGIMLLLASDASAYITGARINVDGGLPL